MSHALYHEENSSVTASIKKREILSVIRKSGLKGISMSDLSAKLNYDRRTIHRLIRVINKSAEKKGGEIIYKEYNKGNFVLSSQIAKNPRSQASIFGRDSIREILGGTLSLSLFPNKINLPKDLRILKEREDSFSNGIFGCREHLTRESRFLYEFSFKMGSFIMFMLYNAVKPPALKEEAELINLVKKKDYEKIKEWRKARIETVSTWINFSTDLQTIFNQFVHQDMIVKGKMIRKFQIGSLLRNTETRKSNVFKPIEENAVKLNALFPNYEVDHSTFYSLEEGYKQIWPYTFKVLKNSRKQERIFHEIEDLVTSSYQLKEEEKRKRKDNHDS